MKNKIREILRESEVPKNHLGVDITRPTQVLIIMRGISGSGKSTKAKQVVGNGVIHSTDDLIDAQGNYREFFADMITSGNFGPLSKMHNQNLKNAIESMKSGISPVVIDNTNLAVNEPKAYVTAALELGYADDNIKFEDVGTGGLSGDALAQRNTHGVPLDKINQMIQRHKDAGPLDLKKVMAAKDLHSGAKILYSAVVLDEASRTKLVTRFKHLIPDDWKIMAHHMTIVFGKGVPSEDVGEIVKLRGIELGMSDKAIAIKVVGYTSANAIPHITIGIAPDAKPVMSNDITNWEPLESYINLTGVVTEVKPQ